MEDPNKVVLLREHLINMTVDLVEDHMSGEFFHEKIRDKVVEHVNRLEEMTKHAMHGSALRDPS